MAFHSLIWIIPYRVLDKEVLILVDNKKLESMQLGFNDIAGAIQNENMTISGGNLLVDGYRRNVRVVGEIRELDELRNVIIKSEKMMLVRLGDVAEIQFDEVLMHFMSEAFNMWECHNNYVFFMALPALPVSSVRSVRQYEEAEALVP